MTWRDKIAAEMTEYEEQYKNYNPVLRDKWVTEQRAWLESMVRIERIWELLREVWILHDSNFGWTVYWNLKKRDGDVPNPDELTAEHVRDGLLLEWPDLESWQVWVEREYAAYKSKQEV